jgi:hypothetical protein
MVSRFTAQVFTVGLFLEAVLPQEFEMRAESHRKRCFHVQPPRMQDLPQFGAAPRLAGAWESDRLGQHWNEMWRWKVSMLRCVMVIHS